MAGFFNPFRAPASRDRRPRYAPEFLETRLSPSGMGSMTMEVSMISTDSMSDEFDAGTGSDILPGDSGSIGDGSGNDELPTDLATNGGPLDFDTEPAPPDGDGEPPYTPPNSGGGPAGPA